MGDGMNKPYSDATGKEIDEEVKRIVDEQWDRTVKLLTEKKDILENLAHLLLEQETIERQDLIETLGKSTPRIYPTGPIPGHCTRSTVLE